MWVPKIGEEVEYLTGKLGVRHVETGTIERVVSDGSGKPFSIKYLINGAWRRNIEKPGSW